MDEKIKILIVEDEADIVEFLTYNLEKEGYALETAADGIEGYAKAAAFLPEVILMDIMVPHMDGIELCQKLRSEKKFDNTLIAFLTARGESFTHVTALDAGGDDFIPKPIRPNVLSSRIRALLRRHPERLKSEPATDLVFGDLTIDQESFSVIKDSRNISLAKKEFELLRLLASKPGKVFKRSEILIKVWGNNVNVGDRTIDVHVRKLREKIGTEYIKTLKGVGYKFNF